MRFVYGSNPDPDLLFVESVSSLLDCRFCIRFRLRVENGSGIGFDPDPIVYQNSDPDPNGGAGDGEARTPKSLIVKLLISCGNW